MRISPSSVAIVIFVVAAAAGLTGRSVVALILVGLGFAVLLAGRLTRRAPAPARAPTHEEAASLADERERNGEVAATKLLRAQQPGLSIVDAVRVVREL